MRLPNYQKLFAWKVVHRFTANTFVCTAKAFCFLWRFTGKVLIIHEHCSEWMSSPRKHHSVLYSSHPQIKVVGKHNYRCNHKQKRNNTGWELRRFRPFWKCTGSVPFVVFFFALKFLYKSGHLLRPCFSFWKREETFPTGVLCKTRDETFLTVASPTQWVMSKDETGGLSDKTPQRSAVE